MEYKKSKSVVEGAKATAYITALTSLLNLMPEVLTPEVTLFFKSVIIALAFGIKNAIKNGFIPWLVEKQPWFSCFSEDIKKLL